MTTILIGQDASFTTTVLADGKPVEIPSNATVKGRLYPMSGAVALTAEFTCLNNATGADWEKGVVAVTLDDAVTVTLPAGTVMLVLTSTVFGIKRYRLIVEDISAPTHSLLFIKDIVVDELRKDELLMAAMGSFPRVAISDNYIWDKVKVAEAEISRILRVPLVPTHYFSKDPTSDQITALNGMPWGVDPGYDYNQAEFLGNIWCYTKVIHKPLIQVIDMRFTYPDAASTAFVVPLSWLKIDKKYAHLQVVPTSNAYQGQISGFMLQSITGGRVIPQMIKIEYVAGLTDAGTTYPELIDAIKKTAVLKMIEGAFLPQSNSISADGLSQSKSIDTSKYHEAIDTTLNGAPGTNGGLMSEIHGIRMGVF